jgi:hypothetical protein
VKIRGSEPPTDSVGDLFAENGDEASVQRSEAFSRGDLGQTGDQTIGVLSEISIMTTPISADSPWGPRPA